MRVPLSDGLYRVTTAYLCAGFVVEGGAVTMCAPILRDDLSKWLSKAVRVSGPAQLSFWSEQT